jgi:hypothetical protein
MSMMTGCLMVCDRCGAELRKLRRYSAYEVAFSLGWAVVDGEDLCPECAPEKVKAADE